MSATEAPPEEKTTQLTLHISGDALVGNLDDVLGSLSDERRQEIATEVYTKALEKMMEKAVDIAEVERRVAEELIKERVTCDPSERRAFNQPKAYGEHGLHTTDQVRQDKHFPGHLKKRTRGVEHMAVLMKVAMVEQIEELTKKWMEEILGREDVKKMTEAILNGLREDLPNIIRDGLMMHITSQFGKFGEHVQQSLFNSQFLIDRINEQREKDGEPRIALMSDGFLSWG